MNPLRVKSRTQSIEPNIRNSKPQQVVVKPENFPSDKCNSAKNKDDR